MKAHAIRLLAAALAAAILASGCGPVQPPAEVAEFQEQAKQARQAVDDAAKQAKAADDAMRQMVDRANQAIAGGREQIARMGDLTALDDQAKAFITNTLADSELAVQQHAMPVIQEAWRRFPDQRKWLEAQLRGQIEGATGEARRQWQEALTGLLAP
jgi:enamine deaminase RidA (YjgF/YER057c/UK114 family)